MFNIFKKKPIKFCIDCKYIGKGNYPDCLHDKAITNSHLDLVSGKIARDRNKSCWVMRIFKCGKRAKYFEPKE